ncbi:MAG: hypothetical protein JRH08_03315 [Deltaproteobacteria bacterium]|nr:hypothetical protein [Deltaproteobacteria bacterium]MBW1927929.1 hypothetical protein [Deltaproteobacteria bacterium]MBW2124728.1 hypothetical protein [Deltaproteobacteria bacterium]RLB14024.1 MAG: hypothetical protein DRG63_09200 [Deltaproteobacteria bacterium]RLB24167.1 MAG: hypothetical protein DRG76_02150 [Deltaproteobacteria bacterium]
MFFLSACAQVPKESVELSVTVGRDLAEVHRAHRELAIEYFDCVKKDINEFIDEVYRPYMIQKTMADFRLLQRIQRAVERGDETRAFNIMKLFVSLLSEQIENYRKELLQNISKQESEVLLAIDDSYQKIQNANAIVAGHLASIRKVHDTQAELLSRTKLEGLREEIAGRAGEFSDKISEIILKARKANETIDKVEDRMKAIKELAAELKNASWGK